MRAYAQVRLLLVLVAILFAGEFFNIIGDVEIVKEKLRP
jgi:hypothetical protein